MHIRHYNAFLLSRLSSWARIIEELCACMPCRKLWATFSQKVDTCASFPKHSKALHSNQAEHAYRFLCKSETTGIHPRPKTLDCSLWGICGGVTPSMYGPSPQPGSSWPSSPMIVRLIRPSEGCRGSWGAVQLTGLQGSTETWTYSTDLNRIQCTLQSCTWQSTQYLKSYAHVGEYNSKLDMCKPPLSG